MLSLSGWGVVFVLPQKTISVASAFWFLEKVLDGGYLSVLLSGPLLLNAAASSSVCSESNEVSCCRLGHISVTALMQFSCNLASLLCSEDLSVDYIPGISTTTMQPIKKLSKSRCTRSKKQQTSPEMLVYRFSERRY